MNEQRGNIWAESGLLDYVVVPVIIGWTKKGNALMPHGLAKSAAMRYPTLLEEYGDFCQRHKGQTPTTIMRLRGERESRNLILLPVVPPSVHPWMSWQNKADSKLIAGSLAQLGQMLLKGPIRLSAKVFIGDVGCEHGLHVGESRLLMEQTLGGFENVIHIRK